MKSHEHASAVDVGGLVLVAQQVEGHVAPTWPGSSVLHLDLTAHDAGSLDVLAERAVSLGARLADPQPRPSLARAAGPGRPPVLHHAVRPVTPGHGDGDGYARPMTLDEVEAYLATLEGCRARRVDGRRAWYVDGLLVARVDAPGTLLVRLGGTQRERLVGEHPDTFGVPPAWEAHTKVQVDLAGDRQAIEAALRLAWERQRAARTT